jgi:hypothetical protein
MAGVLSREKPQTAPIHGGVEAYDEKEHHWVPFPEEKHVCKCQTKDLAGLATKLLKVMQECAVVSKDKKNPDQNYKYTSSDAVLGKVNSALVKAGLVTICHIDIVDRRDRTTRSGAVWELTTVKCRITLIDTATGASIESEGVGQGFDSSDKAFSKAQTQAKKYGLMLMLNISTGEDPEGETQSEISEEPIKCKHCKGDAVFESLSEFEGCSVKVYVCSKCKKETRVKV